MTEVRMVARTVGTSDARSVVSLVAVTDPNEPEQATGHATITINDPDALDEFQEGKVYWVTFEEAEGEDAGPHAAIAEAHAAARAIPNSTNTPGYVTPPELKAVPPAVPDGVVTAPRSSVPMPRSDAWDVINDPNNPNRPPHPVHPPHPGGVPRPGSDAWLVTPDGHPEHPAHPEHPVKAAEPEKTAEPDKPAASKPGDKK